MNDAALASSSKAARRKHALIRQRERTQFLNSWIDEGYRAWRANQRTKDARVRFDLQYELALTKAKETRLDIARHNHDTDNREGVEWFERNMKRLGVGGDADAIGGDAGRCARRRRARCPTSSASRARRRAAR